MITHILKFKLNTVEKKSSTIGSPTGIKPMLVQCHCTALTAKIQRVANIHVIPGFEASVAALTSRLLKHYEPKYHH